MIELYQLEQLLAFAEYGTLSLAAEKMHISQPTLTRTMKMLEEEFDVELFYRSKNRMELNDNGKLVLDHAKKILAERDDMMYLVRAADRAKRTITLGCCAPVPLNLLVEYCSAAYPDMMVSAELKNNDVLEEGLEKDIYQCIVIPYKPDQKEWYSCPLSTEDLMFALPKNHPLSDRASLAFSDLNGENILIYSKIGFWLSLAKEYMPDSRFLMQPNQTNYRDIMEFSILPAFVTDATFIHRIWMPDDRIPIPISDESAHIQYYFVCKKETKKKLHSLLQMIMQV